MLIYKVYGGPHKGGYGIVYCNPRSTYCQLVPKRDTFYVIDGSPMPLNTFNLYARYLIINVFLLCSMSFASTAKGDLFNQIIFIPHPLPTLRKTPTRNLSAIIVGWKSIVISSYRPTRKLSAIPF